MPSMRSFVSLSLLQHFLFLSIIEASAQTQVPNCAADHFNLQDVLLGSRILSVEAKARYNYTSFGAGPLPALSGLNFCQVQVHLTHLTSSYARDAQDNVLVEVWLPLSLDEWNGRFQATGGAGWATGMFEAQLGSAVKGGWAAVSTNGGHGRYPVKSGDGSRFLKSNHGIDWTLMHNFAIRSPVEQVAIGKMVTAQYFGKDAHHSYWNGCSTGGRQGYSIAQRFPTLLDGILAEAPAIGFTQLVIADFWPSFKMSAMGVFPSNCELNRYRAKVIEACDHLDGVEDGMLEDPEQCDFDPLNLLSDQTPFECDGEQITWSVELLALFSNIIHGPATGDGRPVFPGFPRGVPLHYVANTTIVDSRGRAPNPFGISKSFISDLILKTPEADLSTLSEVEYFELFAKASYEFGGALNADNPDLSMLQASRTKLLSWHGLDDQLIPYRNTLNYRERVENMMGGPGEVNEFYRLFLAPGVAHCGGGMGPVPQDPLAVLVDWVEHGIPPETLPAVTTNGEGDLVTRDLCAWPARSKYIGVGDPKRASRWTCEGGIERKESSEEEEEPIGAGRVQEILGVLADRFKGMGLGVNVA